jgi:hypothetical protein
MVRMQQEEFSALLQEVLNLVSAETAVHAARHNNRAFLHQCMTDLIEWRNHIALHGGVPGIDPEDVESEEEGQGTF